MAYLRLLAARRAAGQGQRGLRFSPFHSVSGLLADRCAFGVSVFIIRRKTRVFLPQHTSFSVTLNHRDDHDDCSACIDCVRRYDRAMLSTLIPSYGSCDPSHVPAITMINLEERPDFTPRHR